MRVTGGNGHVGRPRCAAMLVEWLEERTLVFDLALLADPEDPTVVADGSNRPPRLVQHHTGRRF